MVKGVLFPFHFLEKGFFQNGFLPLYFAKNGFGKIRITCHQMEEEIQTAIAEEQRLEAKTWKDDKLKQVNFSTG